MKTVEDCSNWAKKADPTARYFTFRTSGDYQCAPCGKSYRGTTDGLADMDMDVYDMTPNEKANVVCWVTPAKAEVSYAEPIE